jgi:RHS repeat-associated protein
MAHLPLMRWDYRDQLKATAQQVVNNGGTPETTYYVYDATGERVRKVTERQAGPGQPARRKDERLYLDGFELFRAYAGDGVTLDIERATLHVMDDRRRVALVESRTHGNDDAPAELVRYQHGNHLDSAVLELSDEARVISYEEYYPYGGTSYQAVRNQTDTSKRYRFTAKERDEESGLYYHGARYCAPWLGRWVNCDPAGLVDGANLYRYTRDNPLKYSDPDGGDPQDKTEAVDLGPLRLRNIQGSVSANVNVSAQLHNLFSPDRSITLDALVAGGRLRLRSDLELPSFGLSGSGNYEFNLSRLNINRQFASAEIDGRASLSAGPLSLTLGLSGYGSTTLPPQIRLNEAGAQLQRSLDEFRGWVGIHGRLDVGNLAVGAFSAGGDIGPGAQGTLQIRGTVGIPSLGEGPATVIGHLSGTLSFSGGQYTATGGFHAALPPIAFVGGSWSLDQTKGFRVQGHYLGPQFGPLGLNVGINPAGNVTEDTTNLRLQDAIRAGQGGTGAPIFMFEPGTSFGYSYFNYSSSGSTFFNIGVSPSSSAVPYYPGGLSQPLAGPSLGPYVGFQLRTSF